MDSWQQHSLEHTTLIHHFHSFTTSILTYAEEGKVADETLKGA